MTAAELKAMYRELVRQPVIVRRYTGSGPSRPKFDAAVMGHARAYGADELIGNVAQGDQKVIVLADDLIAAGLPLPLTTADKTVVAGRELAILAPLARKAEDGTPVAYELQCRG